MFYLISAGLLLLAMLAGFCSAIHISKKLDSQ